MISLFKIGTYKLQNEGNKNESVSKYLGHILQVYSIANLLMSIASFFVPNSLFSPLYPPLGVLSVVAMLAQLGSPC
jgi:hypothetical protein